jgi:hypothetical protein
MRLLLVFMLAASAVLAAVGSAGGTAAAPSLQVRPRAVRPGADITITGAQFRPRLMVTLSIRAAAGGKRSRVGIVRATAAGTFRFSKTISRSTAVGKYVARACQRSCRIKATATFFVAKIKPV